MVGLVLAVISGCLLGAYGLLQRRIRRELGGAFRRTGAASAQSGPVVVEGAVVSRATLRAPCSGKPCLYWEVQVSCEWDEPVEDRPGHWRAGQQHYGTRRKGSPLWLDDGSGPIEVDLGVRPEEELTHSFERLVSVRIEKVPRELTFGEMTLPTPPMALQDRSRAYRAVERILPANNKLLVRGTVVGGVLRRAELVSTRLRRERVGRERALSRWVVGGAFAAALAAVPLMFLGPWPLLRGQTWEAEPLSPAASPGASVQARPAVRPAAASQLRVGPLLRGPSGSLDPLANSGEKRPADQP